jgi:hypothetical protein
MDGRGAAAAAAATPRRREGTAHLAPEYQKPSAKRTCTRRPLIDQQYLKDGPRALSVGVLSRRGRLDIEPPCELDPSVVL